MAQANHMYSEVEPHCEWVPSVEFDTLLVDLADFKKEDLKAQVDTARNLTISGECKTEDNKWCRFRKTFQLPKECEVKGIKAKFDQGTLYVMVPKPTTVQNHSPHEDGNGSERKDESSNGLQGMSVQQGNYNQMGRRNLAKQKQVMFNVFIAILLVGLVLFTTYRKPNQPHQFNDAS
ncbi:hypothetical protein LUZ60_005556 [Juncus effusus]|nr:hypothetical protein LUZ60_005556 [Juncus effusus]